jgi:hypothetical protein
LRKRRVGENRIAILPVCDPIVMRCKACYDLQRK